ncbi:hypothetical protein TNCV_4996241 [Trichonephila clavipes]|nr:hypothetical protein TNCV_4996241 [Trichonephila clavipes]
MFDPSSFANPTPLAHADTSRDVLPRGGTSQWRPTWAVPTVKKRRRIIVLSVSHDSVTTARLKTYNVNRAIGVQRARDQKSRDRQGRPKSKRLKKEFGGERREVYKESERSRRGLDLR